VRSILGPRREPRAAGAASAGDGVRVATGLWPCPNRVRSHLWTRPSRRTTRGDRLGRQVRALQRRGWPRNPGRLGPFAALSPQRGHRRRLRRNNGKSDGRGSGSALCAAGQSYGELLREVHPRTRQNITQGPSRLGSFQSRPEKPAETPRKIENWTSLADTAGYRKYS
jgi:hypothetical protein